MARPRGRGADRGPALTSPARTAPAPSRARSRESSDPLEVSELRSAAALAFVEDLDNPELAPADARHLSAVLRLRAGEVVVASDGAGRARRCLFVPGRPRGRATGALPAESASARLEPAGPPTTLSPPLPRVAVGFALVRADRTDAVVRQLTELGVDRIVPLLAARSVARAEGEDGPRRAARLGRVAREAAMQARRWVLPEITAPLPLAEAVAELASATGTLGDGGGGAAGPALVGEGAVALAEPGGDPLPPGTTAVLVGPEGGFTEEELALVPSRVGLGPFVLRTETAAVAAGALLVAARATAGRTRHGLAPGGEGR